MGGDKKKQEAQAVSQQQQDRFNQQQGPLVNAMAYNYGRGSEADYGNYTDMMNMYRNIASGSGMPSGDGSGGGGGGGGGGSTYTPFTLTNNDPYKSYEGYTDFSKTGGYSPTDMANLRARGVSPIRAAYANAEREVGRQRSLQGGYSPNAFAVQAKMAREMGQANADAVQNVEAGIIDKRNTGRISGLEGMRTIESDRYNKDLDIQKYNAAAQERAQSASNASADAASANAANAAAASRADQFRALDAMRGLYGTTPGMTNMFGNQVGNAVQMGANFGSNVMQNGIQQAAIPTKSTQDNINSWIGTGQNVAGAVGTGWNAYNANRPKKTSAIGPTYQPGEI